MEFTEKHSGVKEFDRVLRVALCPNRLEFRWAFYHTGEEYGDPPREFFVKVTATKVRTFFHKALTLLKHGQQVDKWDGIGVTPNKTKWEQGEDDYQVHDEPPDTSPREGEAEAPFHATFSAHFAEASERFPTYDNGKLIRIPITNLSEVWYGPKGES